MYDTLHLLKNEIKANAISIHSNLGGGQHRHLVLVISLEVYGHVANVAYTLPLHPRNLEIAPTTTKHVADHHMTRTHVESLRVFHEVRGIERTLFQKLVTATDSSYLAALRNRMTGQFSGTKIGTSISLKKGIHQALKDF